MSLPSLELAIVIATDAHLGQVDKGGRPYILHPLHVMSQMNTDEERIVAVLHDVLEDSDSWTIQRLRESGFSTAVLSALAAITRERGVKYTDYIEVVRANALARLVKIEDLKHNMDISRLVQAHRDDAALMSMMRKYLCALARLQDD